MGRGTCHSKKGISITKGGSKNNTKAPKPQNLGAFWKTGYHLTI